MSVEIWCFNEADGLPVSEIALAAGELCVAQGMSKEQAFTTGVSVGQYAAELVFTVLRDMGVIPVEGIDIKEFIRSTKAITEIAISP